MLKVGIIFKLKDRVKSLIYSYSVLYYDRHVCIVDLLHNVGNGATKSLHCPTKFECDQALKIRYYNLYLQKSISL